jgi:hypothetical protein
MTTDECIKYDRMVEYGIATAEEINLVRCIVSGSWTEVLNSIIYARTGYQTIEDWLYEEMEDCEDTEEDIEEA